MSSQDLSLTFTVDEDPDHVFAVINDVRSWWAGDIDGVTDVLGATFTYSVADLHQSTQQITELVPGELVSWRVVDGLIRFVEDQSEWTDTVVRFEIAPSDVGTQVRFTHIGLVPDIECYESCSSAWRYYVGTCLRNRLTTEAPSRRSQDSENGG